MAYYRICPDCGCTLDPGEKCDCRKEKERKEEERQLFFSRNLEIAVGGQIAFRLSRKEES